MHENYAVKTSANSDIAVLILDELVEFSKYIQPICLPASIDSAFNVLGTVVGYGHIDSKSKYQSVSVHAELITIDPYTCLSKNRLAPDTVSVNNSFCAKSDVSVPCIGELFSLD